LHAAVKPIETLFVVDAMMGQDAANTAKSNLIELCSNFSRAIAKKNKNIACC
jgi:signal recognition particle GTPase